MHCRAVDVFKDQLVVNLKGAFGVAGGSESARDRDQGFSSHVWVGQSAGCVLCQHLKHRASLRFAPLTMNGKRQQRLGADQFWRQAHSATQSLFGLQEIALLNLCFGLNLQLACRSQTQHIAVNCGCFVGLAHGGRCRAVSE